MPPFEANVVKRAVNHFIHVCNYLKFNLSSSLFKSGDFIVLGPDLIAMILAEVDCSSLLQISLQSKSMSLTS